MGTHGGPDIVTDGLVLSEILHNYNATKDRFGL